MAIWNTVRNGMCWTYTIMVTYGFQVAREETKLPTVLASVINKVIFDPSRKLRVEVKKLQEYIDYCLWNYREYYKARQTKQLAEG